MEVRIDHDTRGDRVSVGASLDECEVLQVLKLYAISDIAAFVL